MDAERLKSIFTGGHEHKAESADSRKRNAGIGLSVCATIIRAHGGDISAESRVGEGTVFRFALNTEESADDEQ